jgi:hypothetical protein
MYKLYNYFHNNSICHICKNSYKLTDDYINCPQNCYTIDNKRFILNEKFYQVFTSDHKYIMNSFMEGKSDLNKTSIYDFTGEKLIKILSLDIFLDIESPYEIDKEINRLLKLKDFQ